MVADIAERFVDDLEARERRDHRGVIGPLPETAHQRADREGGIARFADLTEHQT